MYVLRRGWNYSLIIDINYVVIVKRCAHYIADFNCCVRRLQFARLNATRYTNACYQIVILNLLLKYALVSYLCRKMIDINIILRRRRRNQVNFTFIVYTYKTSKKLNISPYDYVMLLPCISFIFLLNHVFVVFCS